MIENIYAGIVAGAIYGLTSWAKTSDEENIENFDFKKFLRTVAIGCGLGIVAAAQNVSIDTVAQTGALGFVTMIVDNVIKIVERKVIPRFQ